MQKAKKRADGRYLIQLHIGWDENGKKKFKYIYGDTIAEVETKAAEARSERENGVLIDESDLTVKEWGERWMSIYKTDQRESTRKMYDRALSVNIYPRIGGARLKDVRNHHLQALLSDMAKDYSKRTVEIARITLSQMFRAAMQNGLIKANPALDLVAKGKAGKERRALTRSEQDRLVAYCKGNCADDMFPLLLYYTGLRKGEALALTRNDIDLHARTIQVNKAVYYSSNAPIVQEPKTEAGIRKVPIPPVFAARLRTYVNSLAGLVLFPARDGGLMSATAFRRLWERFIKGYFESTTSNQRIEATEPEPLTCHMLRHTYATMLYDLGVDVKTAQAWLGHADPTVTMKIYTHLSQERESRSFDLLKNWEQKGKKNLTDTESND